MLSGNNSRKKEGPPNRWGLLLVNWRVNGLALLWAVVLVFSLSNVAHAVPTTTSYQGYLENSDAEPLNATVNMTFALYGEDGVSLWSETHPSVTVTNGVFSLVLGSVESFENVDLDGKRFLGIRVGDDAEMSPRQELTSGFSALRAGVADSVGVAAVDSEAIADGAVTGGKIAAGSISADKIVAGVTITAEERQKLEGLGTGGIGSNPTFDTVVIEDQLNVKKRIKVGENSLYLGSNEVTGTTNSIYTTDNALFIQSFTNDQNTIINASSTGQVGIGTNGPQAKLHVNGSVFLEQGAVPSSTNDRLYNSGGALYWNTEKLSNVSVNWNDILGIPSGFSDGVDNGITVELDPEVGLNTTSYVPRWNGTALVKGTIYDNDNVGIGTNDPKAKLDIKGVVRVSPHILSSSDLDEGLLLNYETGFGKGADIFSTHGGLSFNKLAINGDPVTINAMSQQSVGIGTDNPQAKLHVEGTIYTSSGGVKFPDGTIQTTAATISAPNDDLIVQGNVGIGTTTPNCKLDVHGNTCLGSNDYLKIGPWKMYQTGGGDVTSYLYIGRTTDMLVRIDWNGRIRAKKFTQWSDERWKTDITPLEGSLDKVSKLQGITYKWDIENNPDIRFDDETHIGFTAQNVEQVLPELIDTDENGYKSMSYADMTAVLVEAVKELKSQNDALKTIVCKDHPEEAICQ